MNIIMYILLIVFASVIVITGITIKLVFDTVHPKRRSIKKFPADYQMDYLPFIAITSDDVRIDAWYIKRQNTTPKGTIVLCHNMGATKEKLLPYAKFLYEAGYSSLLFDARSHGWSGNDYNLWNIFKKQAEDIKCVVEYIMNEDTSIEKKGLVLMALSIGGVASILYSDKSPLVKAMIFDSGPPFFVDDMINRFFERAVKMPKFPFYYIYFAIFKCIMCNNYKQIIGQSLENFAPHPILFIHGDRDFITPHYHTQALYNHHARDPKEYWLVPNAFHLTAHFSYKEIYKDKVVEFCSRVF